MTLPFDKLAITADQLAVIALLLIVVGVGMRLLYGAWPWEVSKTWYRTRQAVAYVEASRGEKKRGPALRPVRDAVDTSSDSFDRSLTVNDTSPLEVTPPTEGPPGAEQLQKSKSVRRRWRKSNQRTHPARAETAPGTTGGSDGGDEAEQ